LIEVDMVERTHHVGDRDAAPSIAAFERQRRVVQDKNDLRNTNE
jgi:hypothetical protein